MKENNIFYVYIYYDPIDNVPFYVGKGSGNRYKQHLKCDKRNPFKINKINKILNLGLEPSIKIYKDNLLEEEAFKLEIELIKEFGRRDLNMGTLCNLTDGGEKGYGYIATKETRKKMSEARLGFSPSQETIEKWKKSRKGYKHSEETKEKIRQGNLGKKVSEEGRRNMSNSHEKGPVERLIKANLGRIVSKESIRKQIETRRKNNYEVSEETREKMRQSQKGHLVSKEQREKLRQVNLGKKLSEETREKIRQGNLGKKMSEESIKKRTETRRKNKKKENI